MTKPTRAQKPAPRPDRRGVDSRSKAPGRPRAAIKGQAAEPADLPSAKAALTAVARGLPIVVLRDGKERSLLRRHPWVYANAVEYVVAADGQSPAGELAAGTPVDIVSAQGRWLACGGYSPASSIRVRCLSFDVNLKVDAQLIAQRIKQAVVRRAPLAGRTNAVRLVFGEADELPGLVVDRYGQWVVVQILSAAMEFWREAIVLGLQALGFTQVYERSDAAARQREGLAPQEGPLLGSAPDGPLEIIEDERNSLVDIATGHKTGAYIDQRDNRSLVQQLAQGRKVANCFCYTGGFSLAALAGGASQVVSIDSSEPALALGQANERLHFGDVLPNSTWVAANVFDWLKQAQAQGETYGLIVLDPPKFAPSSQHLDRAARAYKEINLKALQLLQPGGWLLTFSCSGAVSVDLFQKIVAGAVIDARIDAQLIGRLAAGADHPMLMTHPEGEYLKGLLLQRL
jgi:23S rRNA (cytosine1962-C5)-methyltransferase